VQTATGAAGQDDALSIHTISTGVTHISKMDYVLTLYQRAYQQRSFNSLIRNPYSSAGGY
jgi:hypothetical protein